MDDIKTKRLEIEVMICQNMNPRERRITLGLLAEYEEMLIENCPISLPRPMEAWYLGLSQYIELYLKEERRYGNQ